LQAGEGRHTAAWKVALACGSKALVVDLWQMLHYIRTQLAARTIGQWHVEQVF
jgi:hypothetical protein